MGTSREGSTSFSQQPTVTCAFFSPLPSYGRALLCSASIHRLSLFSVLFCSSSYYYCQKMVQVDEHASTSLLFHTQEFTLSRANLVSRGKDLGLADRHGVRTYSNFDCDQSSVPITDTQTIVGRYLYYVDGAEPLGIPACPTGLHPHGT